MGEKLKREIRQIYDSKEQSQQGIRATYLDMARGIAILLVVIGHSGLISHIGNIWLSTFHLPTFFLLSGVLMQRKEEDKRPISGILLRKAKGILIPYFWFSLGALGLDLLQVFRGKFTWDILWEHVVQTISLQGYSVLWFLPVLFFAEILLVVLYKAYERLVRQDFRSRFSVAVLLTCCCAGGCYGYQGLQSLPVSGFMLHTLRIFVKVLIAAAFMSYGYLFGRIFTHKEAACRRWHSLIPGMLLCTINIVAAPYIQIMDLNLLDLRSPWIYLLLGITGGIGCILLCRSIPNIPLLTFFGQNSLIIMCTHMNFYVMHVGMVLSRLFTGLLPEAEGGLYVVCAIGGTMLLSIPVILCIRLFFPFVLGRKNKHPFTHH